MGSTTIKTILAGTVSLLALASTAYAQVVANAEPESVTVTGTRIRGTDTPTPVQIQTAEQLQDITPASISEGLDKNPIFMGGSTPNNATTGANGRGGNLPGYFLNLRNLGTIRTLVLLDGHRVPGTNYDTTVDTQALPQLLVNRVEVVTGGASAVYGSDAVTGVVNFILDRKFEGLKGLIQVRRAQGQCPDRHFRLWRCPQLPRRRCRRRRPAGRPSDLERGIQGP